VLLYSHKIACQENNYRKEKVINMEKSKRWSPPLFKKESIKTGDMPGDKIKIDDSHINRANIIYPQLREHLENLGSQRLVVSVYGGSGVGKSEIASILAHYSTIDGFKSYVLSGDNYPYRIPEDNDKERLRTFRNAGLQALAERDDFKNQWMIELKKSWATMDDLKPVNNPPIEYNWKKTYYNAGKKALKDYLATSNEINFELINNILSSFKNEKKYLTLKRMGRTNEDISMESVDFSETQVLFVEWTHGNNDELQGIDFPIFLFSTPVETLAHRISRGRDNNLNNPFINLVLEIEQQKLIDQVEKAKLIVSQKRGIIPLSTYKRENNHE
jgi:alpha-galactosidase